MPDLKVHHWFIASREYAHQEARRVRRHADECIDPSTTALIVVDMVKFFAVDNPYFHGIVRHINALASALRAAGGMVAWVLPEVEPEPSAWAMEVYGSLLPAVRPTGMSACGLS